MGQPRHFVGRAGDLSRLKFAAVKASCRGIVLSGAPGVGTLRIGDPVPIATLWTEDQLEHAELPPWRWTGRLTLAPNLADLVSARIGGPAGGRARRARSGRFRAAARPAAPALRSVRPPLTNALAPPLRTLPE